MHLFFFEHSAPDVLALQVPVLLILVNFYLVKDLHFEVMSFSPDFVLGFVAEHQFVDFPVCICAKKVTSKLGGEALIARVWVRVNLDSLNILVVLNYDVLHVAVVGGEEILGKFEIQVALPILRARNHQVDWALKLFVAVWMICAPVSSVFLVAYSLAILDFNVRVDTLKF